MYDVQCGSAIYCCCIDWHTAIVSWDSGLCRIHIKMMDPAHIKLCCWSIPPCSLVVCWSSSHFYHLASVHIYKNLLYAYLSLLKGYWSVSIFMFFYFHTGAYYVSIVKCIVFIAVHTSTTPLWQSATTPPSGIVCYNIFVNLQQFLQPQTVVNAETNCHSFPMVKEASNISRMILSLSRPQT